MHLNPPHADQLRAWNVQRRSWVFIISLSFAVIIALPSSVEAAQKENVRHVVIFWLKRPASTKDRERLARASERLHVLPGVLRVETGRALPVRRPGIEQPFDLCVIFTFRNQAALDQFETDPRHKAAVKSVLKPLVKRYAVFNSVVD